MAECERCRQTGRQFNAMVRDVKALAGAWNATRARLVAEVERGGRLEAALDDSALADRVVEACKLKVVEADWVHPGAMALLVVDLHRDALRAAMQDAPDQNGKEADKDA